MDGSNLHIRDFLPPRANERVSLGALCDFPFIKPSSGEASSWVNMKDISKFELSPHACERATWRRAGGSEKRSHPWLTCLTPRDLMRLHVSVFREPKSLRKTFWRHGTFITRVQMSHWQPFARCGVKIP